MLDSQITPPPLPVQDGVRFASLPFDGRYCVSDDGRVFSCAKTGGRSAVFDSWRELKPCTNNRGYLIVGIAGKNQSVHRLVLTTFAGQPPRGCETLHRNGVKTDNRLVNLRWGSKVENEADKVIHGSDGRGERSSSAKLTNAQADLCRQLRARHPGRRSGVGNFLARWYEMSNGSIRAICIGKAYQPEPEVVAV